MRAKILKHNKDHSSYSHKINTPFEVIEVCPRKIHKEVGVREHVNFENLNFKIIDIFSLFHILKKKEVVSP